MTSKSVLVTGATGFVGGAVTRALIGAGYQVQILVRSPERAADLIALGARPVPGDMRQPDSYRAAAGSVGAVVHAAQRRTSGRVTEPRLAQLERDNAIATESLAGACRASGARFLYTSGCYIYGEHGEQWVTEDMPLDPSPLGVNHAAQVRWLREQRDRGLDYVVLSPGFVYGPGGTFLQAFVEPARRGLLRCIGSGQNYFSTVQVDDLATAYVDALSSALPGEEYLIADHVPLTLRGFVDQIAAALGRRPPGSAPRVVAGLIAGHPAVASLASSCRVSAAKARKVLGWRSEHPSAAEGVSAAVSALLPQPGGQPARRQHRSPRSQ